MISKAVMVANYKTTDESCLDFWRSVGLEEYITALDKEVALLIWCSVVTGSITLLVLFIFCMWLCTSGNSFAFD